VANFTATVNNLVEGSYSHTGVVDLLKFTAKRPPAFFSPDALAGSATR
jgi:hypothetical protein